MCPNFEEAVRFAVVRHLNPGLAESDALTRARKHRLTRNERNVVTATLRFAARQKKTAGDKPRQ